MRDEDLLEGMRQAMAETTPKDLDARILAQAQLELRASHQKTRTLRHAAWMRWFAAAAVVLVAIAIWSPWSESSAEVTSGSRFAMADGGVAEPLSACQFDDAQWPRQLFIHQGAVRARVEGEPIQLAYESGYVVLRSGEIQLEVLREGDADMAAWKTRYKLGAGLTAGALLLGIQLFGDDAVASIGNDELKGEGEYAYVAGADGSRQLEQVASVSAGETGGERVKTRPFSGEEESLPLSAEGFGGQVIDARTKKPIEGALVSWQDSPANILLWHVQPGKEKSVLGGVGPYRVPAIGAEAPVRAEAMTKGSGRFFLPKLPKDYVQIAVHAKGYAPIALRDAKFFEPGRRGDVIELHPAQWLELTVVDDTLEPVRHQEPDRLSIRLPVDGETQKWHEKRMTLDDAGRLIVQLDRREVVRFVPHFEGFESTEQTIRVNPGRNVQQLVLKRAPSVMGTVLDAQGEPVVGAKLTIHSKKKSFFRTVKQRRVSVTTDSRGHFRATVAGSNVEILVDAKGYDLAKRFDCKPGDHKVVIRLSKFIGGRVEGRLVDHRGNGISSALVFAHYTERSMDDIPHAKTDAGGRFIFEGLPPGELRILYPRSEDGGVPEGHRIFFGVESELLAVVDGETISVPDILVPIGGIIEGIARSPSGGSIWGSVQLFELPKLRISQPRPLALIRPNKEGEFVIQGVPAGQYGVTTSGGAAVKLLEVQDGQTTKVSLGGTQCKLALAIQRRGQPIGKSEISLAQVGGRLTDAVMTRTDDTGRMPHASMAAGTWFFRVEETVSGEVFFGRVEVSAPSDTQVIQWPLNSLVIDLPENRSGDGVLRIKCKALGATPLAGVVPPPYLRLKPRRVPATSSQLIIEGLAEGEYELSFEASGKKQKRGVIVSSGTSKASLR